MTITSYKNEKARLNRAHFSLILHKYLSVFIEEGIWKTHQEASSDKVSDEGYLNDGAYFQHRS